MRRTGRRGGSLVELARRSGMRGEGQPSLGSVQRRRSQLRAIVLVVVASLGATVVVLSGAAAHEVGQSQLVGLPTFRIGVVALLFGFGGYVVEKESYLRQLDERLVAEQVQRHAEEATLRYMVAVDQLKSDFVASVDGELSAGLSSLAEIVNLLDSSETSPEHRRALRQSMRRDLDSTQKLLATLVADHDRALLDQRGAVHTQPDRHDEHLTTTKTAQT